MAQMEFDEVLEHVGDIGVYQVTLFLMLGAFEFMTADVVAMNFIAGYQDHWCEVPQLANFSHAQQKYISIPIDKDGEYESCKVFDLPWDTYTEQDFINWNRTIRTDGIDPIDCEDGWVFDKSMLVDTIRSDFDLVCSRSYLGELVSSVYMVGILIGAMAGGLASDRFGRKWAFLGSLAVKTVGNLMSTLAPNYGVFVTGRFITGAGGMGSGVSVYVLISEFTLSKYRCILGVLWFTIWSLTYATMPGIAYFLRDWVPLMGVYTYPLAVLFAYIPFLDESPRWLIAKKRFAEATAIIVKMAAINGTTVPENMNLSGNDDADSIPDNNIVKVAPMDEPVVVETEEMEEKKKEEEGGKKEDGGDSGSMIVAAEVEDQSSVTVPAQQVEGNRQGNFFDLFKTPNLRKKTLIIYLVWFTNNLVYYGVSLNSGSLAGDIYLNTFLLGLVEIPANILCFLLSNWIGRTWTIGFSLVLAGVCSLIQIPLIFQEGQGYANAVTALSIIGKGGVTSSFSGIYVLTSELFPTGIRNVGLGSASMCARISGIIAPFMGDPLINVWAGLPSLIFGVFSFFSGLATLLLPETLNQPLPETIEQAEAFGKKGVSIEPVGMGEQPASTSGNVQTGEENAAFDENMENTTL